MPPQLIKLMLYWSMPGLQDIVMIAGIQCRPGCSSVPHCHVNVYYNQSFTYFTLHSPSEDIVDYLQTSKRRLKSLKLCVLLLQNQHLWCNHSANLLSSAWWDMHNVLMILVILLIIIHKCIIKILAVSLCTLICW